MVKYRPAGRKFCIRCREIKDIEKFPVIVNETHPELGGITSRICEDCLETPTKVCPCCGEEQLVEQFRYGKQRHLNTNCHKCTYKLTIAREVRRFGYDGMNERRNERTRQWKHRCQERVFDGYFEYLAEISAKDQKPAKASIKDEIARIVYAGPGITSQGIVSVMTKQGIADSVEEVRIAIYGMVITGELRAKPGDRNRTKYYPGATA